MSVANKRSKKLEKIKVNISDKKESKIPSGLRILIRRACLAVLTHEDFPLPAEVEVSFVTKEEIKQLNYEFRNKNAVTDVLSFPLGENGVYDINPENNMKLLGDIVICTEVAFEQADTYGHSVKREICFLTVHSMLHLLGYDHIEEDDGVIMRNKEKQIMQALGIER